MQQNICLGCGKTKDKSDLLRFTAIHSGEIAFDFKQKIPGRGVYLCFDKVCIDVATRQNKFSKAFGFDVNNQDTDYILGLLRHVYEKYMFTLMRQGVGAKKIESSVSADKKNTVKNAKLCIVSGDVGKDTEKNIERICSRYNIEYMFFSKKEMLSDNLDGKYRAAYFVFDKKLADKLKEMADKLNEINNWVV